MSRVLTFEFNGEQHTVIPKKPTRARLREAYLMLVEQDGEDYDPAERFCAEIDGQPPEQADDIIQALAAAEVRGFYDFLQAKVNSPRNYGKPIETKTSDTSPSDG